jgi:alpha-glucosidase
MLALPGASFGYQGQELGLEQAELRNDERQDPIFARTNGERLGRDGCRVPLPWTDDGRGLGFTTGVPWLPMPEEWAGLSIEQQQGDADATLELTRRALALRREHLVPGPGSFAWRESPPGTLVFERTAHEGTLVCVVNVSGEPYPLEGAELLLTSTPSADLLLQADASAWLLEGLVRG